MKKVLLSGFVIVTFIGYALQQRVEGDVVNIITPNTSRTTPAVGFSTIETPTNTPAPTPQSRTPSPIKNAAPPPPPPTPTPQQKGKYKDGQYTGIVADAFYGNMQVLAVIRGGKITDVQFLQYPNDRNTSRMINSQAMPYLKQEAILAQSARVDGVSGATASSQGFVQSLQSALNQAL